MGMKKRNSFNPNIFKGVAHRGLHDDKRFENSLSAFKNAIDHDFCFELDIHLTTDNQLVVCHDSDLKRVTGKEGIIEELDSKTLRENYKLLDGEDIPTLQEVFDLNKERETIVIELKVYKDNWVNIAKRLMDFLSQVKDTSKVTLISFDPRALAFCDGKKFTRGFLVCKERKDMIIFGKVFEYLDIEDSLLDDKKIIKYRKKGGIVNTWTIRDEKALNKVKGKCDFVTFENISKQLEEDFKK